MTKPEVLQPKEGDHIAVLMGPFDPPTIDHVRAVEALREHSPIKHVWICPLLTKADPKHVKSMCMSFSIEMSFRNKPTSVCTVALDKSFSEASLVMEWMAEKYPKFGIRPAFVLPNDPQISIEKPLVVNVGPPVPAPLGSMVVSLPMYVPVRADIRESIKVGHDESRNLLPGVWNYIQKNKLYR